MTEQNKKSLRVTWLVVIDLFREPKRTFMQLKFKHFLGKGGSATTPTPRSSKLFQSFRGLRNPVKKHLFLSRRGLGEKI